MVSGAAVNDSGAEQATKWHKRGRRGNGRRLRRRLDDAKGRRAAAVAETALSIESTAFVLERIDGEIRQLIWEMRTGWAGEPGQGPREPQGREWEAMAARPGIPPREVQLVNSLLRPWVTYVPKTPVTIKSTEVVA